MGYYCQWSGKIHIDSAKSKKLGLNTPEEILKKVIEIDDETVQVSMNFYKNSFDVVNGFDDGNYDEELYQGKFPRNNSERPFECFFHVLFLLFWVIMDFVYEINFRLPVYRNRFLRAG